MLLPIAEIEHGPFLARYWSVLSDDAHLATELTVEAVTFVIGIIYGRFWLQRHDRKHHTTKETNAST